MDSEDYSKYAENWENKRVRYQVKQKFKEMEREVEGKTKISTESNRDKIDEIKDRLEIVDVIEKSVKLHHVSGNEYAGTVGTAGHSGESLKVDKNGQVWKDFKNGRGGDVLDWVGYINGLDARGADFPEVLQIAADLAGVELEEMTEEERDAAKEKADIQTLFTAAAEIYHKNLTPELYDHILQKWGITRETVDLLKIGYATTGRNLKDLDKENLKKSGLFYVNGEMLGREVFQGRIIFPYWKNGKVVYLIGRETKETPEAERENGMKYKKLLVHKKGREYLSPSVQNSYFYGEDSLRGSDYCIITEGVADCISMLQAGFPCISPVTVSFRDKDHPKLIELTKRLSKVYICNDNEGNKAGLKGALSTAEALENAGIETRLIILPKPEGIEKIDIADYMKDHNKDGFKELMESSLGLWDFKLNQVKIKANSTSIERLRAFRTFISNELHLMQLDEWQIFVNNEVPKIFGLSKKDVKTTVEEVTKTRQVNNKSEIKEPVEKTEEKQEAKERLNGYPEEIRELAYQILKEGDAFNFVLETWNLRHVGDRNIGENCLCAVASTYILNTRGLHVKPSGESGKGKSDAIETVLTLLPEHKYISGSMSSKSLYYHPDLKSGTIIYSDDANFTDDTIATLKQSTSNFQASSKHRTVVNQEYAEYSIPERCSFWFSTVDGIPDEQLANRFLNTDVDGPSSLPLRIDSDVPNLGKFSACRRIARTIYLGSAPTLTAANRGLEDRRVKLGCVMPGESSAVFGDALRRLSSSATYLYQDGPRYWYSTQPTVTKLAEDRAEQLKRDPDKVVKELDKRLRADLRHQGDFSRVHPLPTSSGDVPDDLDARLVVLGIDHTYTREAGNGAEKASKAILESRGSSPRQYRNTLVFLAADKTRLQDLDEAVRKYLAWESILGEKEILDLSPHQVKQAQTQRDAADKTVTARIPETYQWLLVPVQVNPQSSVEWEAIRLTGQDPLAVRASKKLKNEELLITALAGTRLRMELDRIPLWRGNNVSVKQLAGDFASYLYLPRMVRPSVIVRAVCDGNNLISWLDDSFTYADSFDQTAIRYRGLRCGHLLTLSEDNLSGLLVKSDVALNQQKAETPSPVVIPPTPSGEVVNPREPYIVSGGNTTDTGTAVVTGNGNGTTVIEPVEQPPKRFYGSVTLDPARVGRDAGKIADEVISHLVGLLGSKVTVTLEIEAEALSGVPDNVVRIVTENSRTLKFNNHGFEKE